MNVIVDKEKIEYMFEMCGIKELEIVIPILKKHIDKMLKSVNDLINEFESDKSFSLEFWYETKERIEKLYFKKDDKK